MKRILKFAGIFLLGIVSVILLSLLLVLLFPSTALNTRSLSYAVKKFGGSYRPSWSELSFNVRSPSFLTERAVLSAKDFCFDEIHGSMKGCLPALELDATVHLLSIRRLDRLVVHAGELRLDSRAAPAAPAKRSRKKSAGIIPSWASRMTLGAVDVEVPRALLASSSGTTVAGVSMSFKSDSSAPLTADAYVVLPASGTAPATRWDANLALDSDLFREGRLTRLALKARARGAGMTAAANAKLEPRGSVAGGSFDASLSNPKGWISRAALEGCEAEAAMSEKSGGLQRADLDCRIVIQPAPFGLGPGPKPKELTGTLSVHGKSRARTARSGLFETRVEARLGPVKGYGGFTLALDADLAGKEGSSLASERRLTVKAAIERFGELVRFLDGTEFAVPAPLNALDGKASASAEIANREGEDRQELVFRARTDLASAKQALVTAVDGKASMRPPGAKPKLKLAAAVQLERVALELPHLELKGVPSPIPDRRIKTGEPARDAAVESARAGAKTPQTSLADYDVTVRTSTPLVIASNLIKSPVPITLDLRAKPAGLSGEIRVEGFDMEVFRQNATIDHVTITPGPAGAAMALDGKVIYKRGDVTVDILLLGSTAKPTVVFESDPPMTQNEIVALVLYGKTPNELDSDQKASAGNASSAMASGAFGLASLYLFASTPVDSVGFDPATQTYEVKFKLPGGATLSVGSNLQESSTLGLRKRLARHWELQTEAGRGGRERNAITTFLQWFERY